MILLATLLILAFLSCFWLYVLIQVSARSFHDVRGAQPLPWVTQWCRGLRVAILLLPLPWLVAAGWMAARRDASDFRLIAWAATLGFSVLGAVVFTMVTMALPWLPLRIGLSGP